MAWSSDDAGLTRYIEHVRQIPLLEREDEHEIAIAAAAGDEAAREKLVRANLRFVVAVALKYRRYAIRLGDLVAEGNLGLMIAAKKFDPHRGTRFVTYASYWIRALILDLVVRASSLVGGGTGPMRSKLFFRLRRERARIGNLALDASERNALLAQRFDTTEDRMEQMLRRLDAKDVSLDATVFPESGTTLLDTLDSGERSVEEELAEGQSMEQARRRLHAALAELDARERYIVEQRFMQDEEASLAAIGRTLGVSRERARQLEARAKQKLRDQLQDLALDMVA
ncbi:MAG: sigma-70 family RNA polymerase sigma factor [Sandaracinaceae bacterium]|jgi:RNA polymerase sigma-32 factor|nr:sigma-70 family RNA polymerase sigma factor [Sandaracinaceae bacterium]